MSRPLVHGRRSQRTTTGVEYPITRKKSVAVATNSGHWNNSTIDTKEGYNDDDDDNDAHPLPAPPPPVHHHDHVESQDEPQSLQLANNTRTNTRTNTRNRIDDDDYNNYPLDQKHFQQPDEKDQTDDLSDIPPPLPSKKTFYTDHKDIKRNSNFFKPSTSSTLTLTSTPTFIEDFMARHPKIARHRRRFAALLFTITTLFLLLVVLLAVLLTRKHDGSNGNNGIIGGNEWGDGTTATTEELKEHNKGISPPPINHSNAPGWTSQGQGEGTFYDPSVRNGVGQFQMGACEYPYINSVMDMIAALNKPDFGKFARASESPACGQCLQVTGPNGTVTVQIVDMCPGCKPGDVDLTPGAFAKIAHLDKGRVRISWRRC